MAELLDRSMSGNLGGANVATSNTGDMRRSLVARAPAMTSQLGVFLRVTTVCRAVSTEIKKGDYPFFRLPFLETKRCCD